MSFSKPLPRANKNLGQHFLRDNKVIQNICDDFVKDAKAIVEIGPGPGILTKFLTQKDLPYLCIEKDPRMEEFLKDFAKPESIVIGDALEIPLAQQLDASFLPKEDLWLVSNLPYNVSVPLTRLFLTIPSIRYMTLMVQKEVGEKMLPTILPKNEQKNGMNSLHVLLSTWFDIKLNCKVAPGAFIPPPKVDSVVLSFTRKTSPILPLTECDNLESFLRKVFSNRRKQVGTVLKSHFHPETLKLALEKAQIDPKLRAETFNLTQIGLLYSLLKKH